MIMETGIVLKIIAIVIAALGVIVIIVGMCLTYPRYRDEDADTAAECDRDLNDWVEKAIEIIIYRTRQVEDDFIKRITTQAEQILTAKNGIQYPEDSSHTANDGGNGSRETP